MSRSLENGNFDEVLYAPLNAIANESIAMSSSTLYYSRRQDPAPRQRETLAIALLVAAVIITNFLVLHGSNPLPWVGAVAGFLLAIPLPAWMLSQKIDWRTDSPTERFLYSVVSAILGLILIGLVINTILPHLGVSRPLDRIPVLASVDLWLLALGIWRPYRFTPIIPRPRLDNLKGADWAVGLLSALCVLLAIVGANRLNNGAGDGVTLFMLLLTAAVLVLMFAKRDTLNPGTLTVAVYFLSAAMLLMTSLRGWYTTGHDIQEEYYVFQLTKRSGDWNIGAFENAYNACLSITILPTELWQLMRINDPYIYKFWFQLLFALCPVFVYRISLRYTNSAMAIIAVMYFVAFPTFFTDMPYLNRQEIAYLFVAACIMAATDQDVPRDTAHIRIGIFSVGVVLSHYSTAYVFLGTLMLGWIIYKLFAAFRFMRANGRGAAWPKAKKLVLVPSINLINVLVMLAGIGLWNGLATHTVGGFGSVITQAIDSLRGGTGDKNNTSTDAVSLGSPAQVIEQYYKSTLNQPNATRIAEGYYTAAELAKYPLTPVSFPNMPVTSVGKVADKFGINVATFNSLLRAGVSHLLQLFVVLGLFSAFARARKNRSMLLTELIAIALGALIIVALQVVLPVLSADYGVLRAFQQALIAFGPLVAVGSLAIFRFLPPKWSPRAAFSIAFVFFLSLVGVISQITGGYAGQLNLNNSGMYYELYYTQPQSVTALDWLQSSIPSGKKQPVVDMDQFAYQELQTYTNLNIGNSVFPTLIQKDAYVFLGYQTIATGSDTLYVNENQGPYKYPVGLLNSSVNLVYSSNAARIYG